MALPSRAIPSEPPPTVEAVFPLIYAGFGQAPDSEPAGIIDTAFEYHFQTKGSLSRPNLTIQAATTLGLESVDALSLAACVETLHNASLIQDDFQDAGAFRRGRPSVAAKFGGDVAIGLSNRLVTTAFACLANFSDARQLPGLIRILHSAVAETINGQTKDLAKSGEACFRSKLETATQKSGPLFALAFRLPLSAAGFGAYDGVAAEAANAFGLGYQIVDDLKDQQMDRESGCGTNLVLLLESEPQQGSGQAQKEACRLARNALTQARTKAAELPLDSGRPLSTLVDRVLSQLAAFDD